MLEISQNNIRPFHLKVTTFNLNNIIKALLAFLYELMIKISF